MTEVRINHNHNLTSMSLTPKDRLVLLFADFRNPSGIHLSLLSRSAAVNRLFALVDCLQPRVQLLVGFEHSLVLELALADVTDVRLP